MFNIDNAPGLTWRRNKFGWEARWRARADLIKRGYRPRLIRLWASTKKQPEPGKFETMFIQDRCTGLQAEMLVWGRGGLPQDQEFDGTVASLVKCYQTDQDSSYTKIRYNTRQFYDSVCRMIVRDIGHKRVAEMTARDLLRWHEQYLSQGKVGMGHSLIGLMRTVCTFGATLLGSKDCRELKLLLGDMRFKSPKPRTERLTADQVSDIIRAAHRLGRPSIALAQAFQFGCTFRQKDVIGEWVPISEPGLSAVINGNTKWARGIDWKEIDHNFILRHVTSKRQKEVVIDLKIEPIIVAELGSLNRADFPASGAVIIDEKKEMPYAAIDFRKAWRECANAAGIPKTIRNMDTRSGAITEAIELGASLEGARKAATHSDAGMTQKYSRGDEQAIAEVMRIRATRKTNRDPNSAQ